MQTQLNEKNIEQRGEFVRDKAPSSCDRPIAVISVAATQSQNLAGAASTLKRYRLVYLVVAALSLQACAASIKAESSLNTEAASMQFMTIAYGGQEDVPVGFHRTEVPPRIRIVLEESLRGELIERLGYVSAAPDDADLILRAGAGLHGDTYNRAVVPPSLSASNRFSLQQEESITTGTLVFDAFDRETGLHVWHGRVQGGTDSEINLDALRAALLEAFATFPPPSSQVEQTPTTSGGEITADEPDLVTP